MVFSLFKAFHGQQILKNRELYFTVIKKLKEAEILELFLFFWFFTKTGLLLEMPNKIKTATVTNMGVACICPPRISGRISHHSERDQSFQDNPVDGALLTACSFLPPLAPLPAVAWRKPSGSVSSGVHSLSHTNGLWSWAGFQACKGQKTEIRQSPATTCLSPAATVQKSGF